MATQIVPQPKVHSLSIANVGLWVLQIGSALFLGYAGFQKLSGDPQMIQLFSAIGFGQWFRYLTGSLEVIGSVGLLVPRLAGYAAALLAVVMAGAVGTHLFIIGGSPVIALILALVTALIAWFRLLKSR